MLLANRDEKGRFIVGTEPGPGRNSKYQSEWMDDQARRLALLGLTDSEIAQALGICLDTYYHWIADFPGFSESIQSGKVRADAHVAESLYNRATGMTVISERAMKGKDGNVVIAQTKTQLPPDTAAATKWLALRQRKKWAEQKDPQGPTPDHDESRDLQNMTDSEIDARLAELEARRAHDS